MAKGKAEPKKGDAKKGDKGDKEPKGAQQINVRHILKEEALAKIRNEGVKFDEVARTFSEDKARAGGALGWKVRGSLDPAFEAVAYALPNSTTASPVVGEAKTSFGYHIIMVEGRK